MSEIVLTYEDYAALPDDGLRYAAAASAERPGDRGQSHPRDRSALAVLDPYHRRCKLALYAKHDVPWYWIVDPGARTIEAYHLDDDAYRLVATLEGNAPHPLPPFVDLPLDPAAVWR